MTIEMPSCPEAEAAVLTGCILDPEIFHCATDTLRPDDFYQTRHQAIFAAILALAAEGIPADLPLLAMRIKARGDLEKIGGTAYLASMIDDAPVVFSENHIYAVKDTATRRAIIAMSHKMAKQAVESETVTDLIDSVQSLVTSTVTASGTKPAAVSCADLAMSGLEVYEERYRNAGKITGIPSGIDALDTITCGFQPSDLIILAARPSMGKTALAIQLCQSAQKLSMFFSLEMSTGQVRDRIVAQGSGVNLTKFRSGRFTSEDWQNLVEGVSAMSGIPMLIDDTPALTVSEIRRRSRIVASKKQLSLIVIDYLQYVRGEKGARSRSEEVGSITRGLKALAKELSCPVLLLSQLNRKFADRTDKKPVLTDLRDSGEIEQDADIVMFLHRPEMYVNPRRDAAGNETAELLAVKGLANLEIAKHRNGPTGDITMTWHPRSTLFTNRDETA